MRRFGIVCISIVICSLIMVIVYSSTTYIHYKSLFNQMDAEELHYDADDWFIMVDKTNDIIGIYKGATPIHHIIGGTDSFDECYEVINIPTFVYGGPDTRWYEDYPVDVIESEEE